MTSKQIDKDVEPPENHDVLRLKKLIDNIVKCCEDRRIYESGRFELPHSELKFIMLLSDTRYMTVKDIARALEVAKSRVTKIVDQLIGKGMVTRHDDPADGRVRLIGLTSAGRRKALEIERFYVDIHRRVLSCVEKNRRTDLLTHLEYLWGSMETVKRTLI